MHEGRNSIHMREIQQPGIVMMLYSICVGEIRTMCVQADMDHVLTHCGNAPRADHHVGCDML